MPKNKKAESTFAGSATITIELDYKPNMNDGGYDDNVIEVEDALNRALNELVDRKIIANGHSIDVASQEDV